MRIHEMRPDQFSAKERSRACFLLRAFAQRASEKQRGPSALIGEASFEEAMGQCLPPTSLSNARRRHQNGSAALTEKLHQSAIRLARLQSGELVDALQAMRLLRAAECNSFFLFDTAERARGSVMYPQAAMINHSCLPNCAMTASGHHLVLEAITPVACGEELTYCYVRSFESGCKETMDPWGFECTCQRCSGTASADALAAFDTKHRCCCGKIVVAEKARSAHELGRCQCHAHNVSKPTAAAMDAKAAKEAKTAAAMAESKAAKETRDAQQAIRAVRKAKKAAAAAAALEAAALEEAALEAAASS
jgi:hypothetical protein